MSEKRYKTGDAICKEFKTQPEGLSDQDALQRRKQYGYNELKSKEKVSALRVLANQFKNLILYVLIAAAIVSVYEGELIAFYVIAGVIVIVVALGFVQEYQAERVMASLKSLVKTDNTVRRSGKLRSIHRKDIVPGDVVVLDTGDTVPADAIVIEATQLRLDESALTGESVPVEHRVGEDLFAGTFVVHGKGVCVVAATGMNTKLGSIASSLSEGSTETPLQKNVTHLTKSLALVALFGSAATFAFGLWQGALFDEILLVALALAVASVPEGLPLALTITLAHGMKRMAKHNAVVRKLVSVETLGSTTVVCTDKTGTLTKNEMTVERMLVGDVVYEVTGSGYAPTGDFLSQGQLIEAEENKLLKQLLTSGILCNNATLVQSDNKWSIIGDPTEAALLVAAGKANIWKEDVNEQYERVEELVFTSERKRMTVVARNKKSSTTDAYVKGAPEVMLQLAHTRMTRDGIKPLTDADRDRITRIQEEFANSAYRVLALGYKEAVTDLNAESLEQELVFLGLVAMIDPPREETLDAIAEAKSAGVDVKMVTGDNKDTARAIAKKVGLLGEHEPVTEFSDAKLQHIVHDHVVTGTELDTIDDDTFATVVDYIDVYARVRPEQKLRIINALKRKGHIVAMTGDGVNDAPALRQADIGVAMGIKGTDVAKNASAMVLQDDNFATIISAIRIGRVLYDNIEKLGVYLISRNFTEIILIFLGMLTFGVHFLPLLAIHILYINLFSEIVPSLGLGLDKNVEDVMKRGPRDSKERLLNRKNKILIAIGASTMALVAYLAFVLHQPMQTLEEAQTFAFATITAMVLFIPFAYRNIHRAGAQKNSTPNGILIGGVIFSGLLTLMVMYTPTLQSVFRVIPLSPTEWIVPVGLALTAFAIISLLKRLVLR